jgi:hypothetical protein
VSTLSFSPLFSPYVPDHGVTRKIAEGKSNKEQEATRDEANKEKKNSAGSDDTASMIKGGKEKKRKEELRRQQNTPCIN